MRVLHVYRTYFPDTQGGLEETIRQICLKTRDLGIESRVLCASPDPDPPVLDLPEARVYRTRANFEIASCTVSFAAFRALRELQHWADVVHYHFPWPFADVLHFATRVRKPTVLTYHSDIVRQRVLGMLYAPLMRRFLSRIDRIVCTSPNYLETSEVLKHYRSRTEVIPIGIDESTYGAPEPEAIEEARRRWGEGYFLFVGVLRYYKGLHILLDALQNAPFDAVIVGAGPIRGELEAQARRLGLDNVHFAGRLPDRDKLALLAGCRAVVFPSFLRAEAFGVTLLEGAMFGKPLISAEVGTGTSHVNVHGETGFIVAPGDPGALREAMDELHDSPEMAEEMGRRARQRYEQLFTGTLMAERYAALYHELEGTASPQDGAEVT